MTSGTNTGLRHFSKAVCLSTLFLIFVGGMVTSTGSGLAVPDWPLSYGTLFPPMVGGIFYEHGHRMVAATVGLLMFILATWLGFKESRRWVRYLGFGALVAVIVQGILGGITVLFFLPTPISVTHATLAQTFFVLTILIAYSQSAERKIRTSEANVSPQRFVQLSAFCIVLIFIQLILGATMRHTGSGLAIPDFPKMGGTWIPRFDEAMFFRVNDWRFEQNLDPITSGQVFIHFIHRVGALLIALTVCILTVVGLKWCAHNRRIIMTILLLDSLVVLQILLGISTVLTQKVPSIASLHVATGAATLGAAVLLFLRSAPVSIRKL